MIQATAPRRILQPVWRLRPVFSRESGLLPGFDPIAQRSAAAPAPRSASLGSPGRSGPLAAGERS